LLLVIVLLAVALVACGGGGNDDDGTDLLPTGEAPLSTEVVGTPSDLGDDGAEEMATPEP
jgi:hypothetical protein